MSTNSTPPVRFPAFRRLWKPALATGAGGTATAIWFEEILMFGQELLALIFLPLMAAGVYLLDHFMFKSRSPRPEDKQNTAENRN